MTWTVKKDFRGITAVNAKETGAVEFRERDDYRFAVISAKYEAFKLTSAEMYQLGYMLITLSNIEDEGAKTILEKEVNPVLFQPATPIHTRNIELPKRADGCIDLGENESISQYLNRKEENNGNHS